MNFCFSSRFVGVTRGNCRRRRRGRRMGSLTSLVGQGESVSLMACSLCRCHLVIILRQPSASWSCRAWLSVFWALCDWRHPCCFLFYSDLLLLSPPMSKRARLVRAREKTEDTCRDTKKQALNSLPQRKPV